MNIRTSIAALAFAFVAASSFAAAPTPAASGFQKVAATAATPAAPAKKMHCPKGEHRVAGKCVKK